jgi:hypothetical protein
VYKDLKKMTPKGKAIKRLLPSFETKQDAFKGRTKIIRALQADNVRAKALARQWAPFIRAWPENSELIIMKALEDGRRAMKMAEQLGQCADDQPCNLSICPICLRRLRKSLILRAVACIAELRLGPELRIVAFDAVSVSSRRYHMQGMLDRIDLAEIKRHIQAQHERADFPLAFARIEIALNENRNANEQDDLPFWQAQVHGIVIGLDVAAVESAIQREYPRAASMPMPLSLRQCSNLPAALDFAFKPEFVRNAGPRKPRLRKAQLSEVALWLSLDEAAVRYVVTGCQFDGNRLQLDHGVRERLKKSVSTRDGSSK